MRVKAHKYLDHLLESIKKNRSVYSPDDDLPSPRTEAKALLRMVGKNGDSLDSMRELIQVQDEVKQLMFKHGPGKEEVKQILRFRERVLAVFDKLAAKQEKKRLRHIRFIAKRQRESLPETGLTSAT